MGRALIESPFGIPQVSFYGTIVYVLDAEKLQCYRFASGILLDIYGAGHFMKIMMVIAMLAALTSYPTLAQTGNIPVIERDIYRPEPPFENTKKAFYVRESERPLLATITDASTSIAHFLLYIRDPSLNKHTSTLRMPPTASHDQTQLYGASVLYCWKSEDKDHLEFLIDWGDITTNARYTDSYIFVRRGASWYFDRHGSTPPREWMQVERYFQRACPTTSNE